MDPPRGINFSGYTVAHTRNSTKNRTHKHGKFNRLIFSHVVYVYNMYIVTGKLKVGAGNDFPQLADMLDFEGTPETVF